MAANLFQVVGAERVPISTVINVRKFIDLTKYSERTGRPTQNSELIQTIRFDLTRLNRDYKIPNTDALQEQVNKFVEFAKLKGFHEDNMDYLIDHKVCSDTCATFLMPNYALDSDEVQTLSNFFIVEWLFDDLTDGDILFEDKNETDEAYFTSDMDRFKNAMICAELIMNPRESTYGALKFPRKKAVLEVATLFWTLARKTIRDFETRKDGFSKKMDEFHQGQLWILQDSLEKQNKLKAPYIGVEYRRYHASGIAPLLELVVVLQDKDITGHCGESVMFQNFFISAVDILMLVNDVFSIDRELKFRAGQNCIEALFDTGLSIDEAFLAVVEKTQEHLRNVKWSASSLQAYFGYEAVRLTQLILDAIDGTIFWHSQCKRYDGITYTVEETKT